jgi:hypothetical protein
VLLDSNLLQNLGISTTQGEEILYKLMPDATSREPVALTVVVAADIVDAVEQLTLPRVGAVPRLNKSLTNKYKLLFVSEIVV